MSFLPANKNSWSRRPMDQDDSHLIVPNYARGNGPVPGSNFQYSGWTTEANQLGNVSYRTGKKIEWDYQNLRATNAPEAAPFIKRPVYRKGWDDILKA